MPGLRLPILSTKSLLYQHFRPADQGIHFFRRGVCGDQLSRPPPQLFHLFVQNTPVLAYRHLHLAVHGPAFQQNCVD